LRCCASTGPLIAAASSAPIMILIIAQSSDFVQGHLGLNSSFCLRDNCRAQELEIDEIASCRGQAARPWRLVTSFRAKGGRTALPALDILSLPPRTAPRRC